MSGCVEQCVSVCRETRAQRLRVSYFSVRVDIGQGLAFGWLLNTSSETWRWAPRLTLSRLPCP